MECKRHQQHQLNTLLFVYEVVFSTVDTHIHLIQLEHVDQPCNNLDITMTVEYIVSTW